MKKSNILIAEDEESLRDTWSLMLAHFDCTVHLASNGQEAIDIINQNEIEVVVTDLQMPIKDGYFVLDHLHSCDKKITTWVCTGELSPSTDLEQFKIDKIVHKPFDMLQTVQELIALVKD